MKTRFVPSLSFADLPLMTADERVAVAKAMPYKDYLASDWWELKRDDTIWRFQYRCATCGLETERLEVHHNTYEHLGAELDRELLPLCTGCHTAVHLVMDARKGKVRPQSWRDRA